MKHKRIVSMLLAAFMTLSMPLSGYAEKTVEQSTSTEVTPYVADTQAPVLNDISISATEVQAGESLTVTIDATDDISGIGVFSVSFKNKKTGEIIVSDYSAQNSLFTKLHTSQYMPSGEFELDSVYIEDGVGNRRYYSSNPIPDKEEELPCQLYFTVKSSGQIDVTPPQITKVEIDKTEYQAGESFVVTLEANDDVSGVETFAATFINLENGRTITTDFSESKNPLVAAGKISRFESNGNFTLNSISISDKAGNHVFYETSSTEGNPELPNIVSFDVVNNQQGDVQPPVINYVTLSKDTVNSGESFVVTLDAVDDFSGVSSFSAIFTNPENGRSIVSPFSSSDNPLQGVVWVSEYEPSGIYTLNQIMIADNANNGIFYVVNPQSDIEEKLPNTPSITVINKDTTSPSVPEDKPSNNSGESNTPSSENSNENSSNVSSGLSLSINRNEVKQESPKQQSKSIQIKDSKTNITISAPKGVLPEGTTAKVSPISNVASSLSDKLGTFLLYDIKLVDENGNTVQPKGTVTVGIPVPDGFDIDKLVVYYIDEEGNLIEYPVVVKDGVAYFETDHFSYYALAEKQGNSLTTQSTTETQTDSNKPNPSTGAQDLTAVLAAAAVSFMGLVVLGKKKH